ncbi:MAG: YbaK/EbsC family protein [Trueperaceae bacterium]|nr:YbaK/EbsC family protein [Trueperaceae bacterium]
MPPSSSDRSVDRVVAALHALGLPADVREMPGSTRTAADAADAVGCSVAQIVKSLVFDAEGDLALVLVGGDLRVDEAHLGAILRRDVRLADPTRVREATGFAIGGVAPVGLRTPLPTYLDDRLLRHAVVWAAAGTPRSVVPLDPARLADATGATPVALQAPA